MKKKQFEKINHCYLIFLNVKTFEIYKEEKEIR
jgi:hypothetical protein